MKVYVGVDLHKRNGVVALMDENHNRIKHKRIPNDPLVYLKFLHPYKEQIQGIVVESTPNWYWLVDILMEAGYPVCLAHPPALQPYSGLKHTDDTHDAYWLAELLMLGVLHKAFIYPKEERKWRDLWRLRHRLVEFRTSLLNALMRKFLNYYNFSPSSASLKGMTREAFLKLLPSPGQEKAELLTVKGVIDDLTRQMEEIEDMVYAAKKDDPGFQRLQTLPGVGPVIAMTIVLEAGPMERFDSAGDFISYCRKVSSMKTSDGKKKGEGNRKNGNRYLAWALSMAAEQMRRYDEGCRWYFQRKARKKRKGAKRIAYAATAAKIGKAIYHMLKYQVPYDPEKLWGKPPSGR